MDRAEKRDNAFDKVTEREAHVYPVSAAILTRTFVGDIPEHDSLESEQGGCKSKERVTRYFVLKHKEPCRIPPDNSKFLYHPHLETFHEIRGTNNESAEQSNCFLNRFKHICNQMAELKFKVFKKIKNSINF